jgi:aminopeptidase N
VVLAKGEVEANGPGFTPGMVSRKFFRLLVSLGGDTPGRRNRRNRRNRAKSRVIGKAPENCLSDLHLPSCPLWLAVCLVLLGIGSAFAQEAPAGISRELAKQRAELIGNLRYVLNLNLVPHADHINGEEQVLFQLKSAVKGNLLLDYREGTIKSLKVNGKDVPAKIENGHIAIPGELLKVASDIKDIASAAKQAGQVTDNLGRPVGESLDLKYIEREAQDNLVEIEFASPIATAGKAITRFEDKDDGNEYIYSLFVPMDADMAFPCFDQPDLKARFGLTLTAPEEWVGISNGDVAEISSWAPGVRRTTFAATRPISTYLFAFAAGPFDEIRSSKEDLATIYVRRSKAARARQEAKEVQDVTLQGIEYLSDYFDQKYPFSKYDMVLIPGFAYGGMEHAGATFLREESILFRTEPTHSDHLNRDVLLLHELTHQWFGDLVTMRWFDDLWLKEGFAQYMAYKTLDSLMPKEQVWKRFYQAMKPAAYAIDATQGTTPIYQDIPNLKDAKSAYGAIVYSKAPGVLRQLAFVIGDDKFQQGLQLYLKEHAFANAEWADLVKALEKASGNQKLDEWAKAYIHQRGMPQVDVGWGCNPNGKYELWLHQHDVLGTDAVWPISTEVLLHIGGLDRTVRVNLNTPKSPMIVNKGCPEYVFANNDDYAYGRFLLDDKSRKAIVSRLGTTIQDPFQRTLLWGSLWESVREAQMDPREYVELALKNLPTEKDEALVQSVIGRMIGALHHYVPDAARPALAARAEKMAHDEMLRSPNKDMRILWFRALRNVAETAQGRVWVKEVLAGKATPPGVEIKPLDRWSMIMGLLAFNDPQAEALLAAEEKRDQTGEGKKYAYMAAAAKPENASKQKYFDDYLHNSRVQEDWVTESLGPFNYWNQTQLTRAYLKPALEALPQMKRERKIFFVLAWLNSFVGSQQSPEAQAEVDQFLSSGNLDRDLKLKVLEAKDELDRTVKIRAKYGAAVAEKPKTATTDKPATPAKSAKPAAGKNPGL